MTFTPRVGRLLIGGLLSLLPMTLGASGGTLFLDYDGPANQRHFGVAIGNGGRMHVLGGDSAAVGSKGYVMQVSALGEAQAPLEFDTEFVGPGVDVDAQDTVYVAGGNAIYRISAAGAVETYCTGFTGAMDVRVGPGGALYVADHREAKIYRVTGPGARELLHDFHAGTGSFLINGLAFSPDLSHLYTYRASNRTIWKHPVNADGTLGEAVVFKAGAPMMVAFDVDAAGNVYGPDFERGELVRVGADGTVTTLTQGLGLDHPIGFRLGRPGFHPGSAFVADAQGVRQVRLPAEITRLFILAPADGGEGGSCIVPLCNADDISAARAMVANWRNGSPDTETVVARVRACGAGSENRDFFLSNAPAWSWELRGIVTIADGDWSDFSATAAEVEGDVAGWLAATLPADTAEGTVAFRGYTFVAEFPIQLQAPASHQWYYSNLDWVFIEYWPWVYQSHLGWLYLFDGSGASPDDLWFYRSEDGDYIWTAEGFYPWYWSHAAQGWLFV